VPRLAVQCRQCRQCRAWCTRIGHSNLRLPATARAPPPLAHSSGARRARRSPAPRCTAGTTRALPGKVCASYSGGVAGGAHQAPGGPTSPAQPHQPSVRGSVHDEPGSTARGSGPAPAKRAGLTGLARVAQHVGPRHQRQHVGRMRLPRTCGWGRAAPRVPVVARRTTQQAPSPILHSLGKN
jgi:hypothetical protein